MNTLKNHPRLRLILNRLGSLVLLFQRMPVVQMLFPEAKILGGSALANSMSVAITTVVGLGAYDSVAGATVISQVAPVAGSLTVPAAVGSPLSFAFKVTGAPSPGKGWTTTALPAGLVHTNVLTGTDSITGTPTTPGTSTVTVTAWEKGVNSGGSKSQAFTMCILGFSSHPASATINSGTTKTLTSTATGVPAGVTPTYQWYVGPSGTLTSPITGATTASYTTPAINTTTSYWVKVTSVFSGNTVTAKSNTATLTVSTPPTVSVAVSPASVTEDGAGNMAYTFSRSGATTSALTANFTVGGTATLTTDFTSSGAATFAATTGTVTFPIGSSTAIVTIDPSVDTTVESNETVILTVASGTGYTLGTPSTATGTITNDDTTLSVVVSPTNVIENSQTGMIYTFTRTGVTTGAITANFTVGGTATPSTDYTQSGSATFSATSGTVTFAAGSPNVAVTLIPVGDTAVESNETVILTVAAGTGYTLGTPTTATGTITNDDTAYSSWASALNVGQNAPLQTPQNDGVCNLLKFAFNLQPTMSDVRRITVGAGQTAGLPGVTRANSKLRIEYLRRRAISNPGITYTPQCGSDLIGWTLPMTEVSAIQIAASEWERVIVDGPVGVTECFCRIMVTQTP